MKRLTDRRSFLKTASAGVAGAAFLRSARGIASPTNHLNVAIMGVHNRGGGLASAFARSEGCEVTHICDVDDRAIAKTVKEVAEITGGNPPVGVIDFRDALDNPDVDILVIAGPDHWHAPAAIMALQAGKHVYVEKPGSHNPHEGELLIEAQQHYNLVVQMGNQQRSSEESSQVIDAIREGIIGRPYYARAWYANSRGSIGTGQSAPTPDWLNYDLWQGPAPRMPYMDNRIHYNWHWFWHWGTGEICNNGTHEIDVCRWALGVDYPIRVTSSGGRYHFKDDWEFYDTQIACYDFEGKKTITWDGRSCNARLVEGRGRGASIHGEYGTAIIDRNGYVVYDQDNNEIWKRSRTSGEATMDIRGGGGLTDRHIVNMLQAIRDGVPLNSPINDGQKTTLLCHLGNIAQKTGRMLKCNPENGHILDDEGAMKMWGREYEPGWEIKI